MILRIEGIFKYLKSSLPESSRPGCFEDTAVASMTCSGDCSDNREF